MCRCQVTHKYKCFQNSLKLFVADVLTQAVWETVPYTCTMHMQTLICAKYNNNVKISHNRS